MDLSHYEYALPDELIAQAPAPRREDSRLLVLERAARSVGHERFPALLSHLRPGDVLALNETRVVPARVQGRKADTGAAIEALFLRETPGGACALLRPAKRITPGRTRVDLPGGVSLKIDRMIGPGEFSGVFDPAPAGGLFAWMDAHGQMPVPPYIHRAAGSPECGLDRQRYQTVFARSPGAAAAPTAGLHFTPELLAAAAAAGVEIARVTLHVGLGTFAPLREENFVLGRLHEEPYAIAPEEARRLEAARREGRRIVAVGTTVVRVLETVCARFGRIEAGKGTTDLFIREPYAFRAVRAMVTNFHVPRSSLLMLVCAFAGREFVLEAYRQAVEARYRFFSYGDATLIL